MATLMEKFRSASSSMSETTTKPPTIIDQKPVLNVSKTVQEHNKTFFKKHWISIVGILIVVVVAALIVYAYFKSKKQRKNKKKKDDSETSPPPSPKNEHQQRPQPTMLPRVRINGTEVQPRQQQQQQQQPVEDPNFQPIRGAERPLVPRNSMGPVGGHTIPESTQTSQRGVSETGPSGTPQTENFEPL